MVANSAAPLLPLALTASALIVVPWMVRLPKLAIGFLLLSLVAGQLLRFPLPGQSGGLLVSDIALVLVIIAALLQPESKKIDYLWRQVWWLALVLFLVWALFLLAINTPLLNAPAFAISLSYWLRLAATATLIPALIHLFQGPKIYRFSHHAFIITITIIALLGILQLAVVPDLAWLASRSPALGWGEGWDPHQARLVSTWLDPNFIGIFFALTLPYVLAAKNRSKYLLGALLLLCIALTQSRTALVTLGFSAIVTLPLLLTHKKVSLPALTATLSIICILIVVSLNLLGGRALGSLTIDPTVSIRLEAAQDAWLLAAEHAVIGTGYNAYQFIAQTDAALHSRAGTDISFLTLWITTGLLGVLLIATALVNILAFFLRRWLKQADSYALATTSTLVALVVSSFFVNSLLYSHLLITVVLIGSLSYAHARS